jgi:hypothetical protein
MEAARSSKMLVIYHNTTWNYNPEALRLNVQQVVPHCLLHHHMVLCHVIQQRNATLLLKAYVMTAQINDIVPVYVLHS